MEQEQQPKQSINWGGLSFIFLVIIGIVWLFNSVGGRWIGMYEDRGIYGPVHATSEFNSKEACLDWKESQRYSTRYTNFECGRKCKPPKTLNGPYVCAETI